MKTLTYYFIGLAMLTFTACKKQSATASLEKQLIGKWQYMGQGGGITGKYYPADPSVKTIFEFKRNNTFVKTENDQLTYEGPYKVIQIRSIFTGKDDNAIRFPLTSDSPGPAQIVAIRKDTLNISDNHADGFMSGYVRVK